MPKAADLTGDALNPQRIVTPTAATSPRSPAALKQAEAEEEKIVPLQIEITEAERRAIKAYAAQRGLTVKNLILSWFHDSLKPGNQGTREPGS